MLGTPPAVLAGRLPVNLNQLSEEQQDTSAHPAPSHSISKPPWVSHLAVELVNHSAFHSVSGLSPAQEGAVFSNTKRYLIPTPPKNPSPASAVDVAARPWKTRNHRGLKIPSQEEDRQCTQQPQSKAHQGNSAQPLDKEPAPLGPHSTMAASGSQEQHQSVGSTSKQRPIAGPAGVGSSRIRHVHGNASGENGRDFTSEKSRFHCCLWGLLLLLLKESLLFVLTFTFDCLKLMKDFPMFLIA